MKKALRLAITGNMGSGKSVVSRMLNIMGVPVYDCDSRAKLLMQNDGTIKNALVRMFGSECYKPCGTLDKEWLAARIFTDSDNVKRVNAIVHPCVKNDFVNWAESNDAPVVAVESAVLYESGLIDVVDKVLLVWADEETSIRRTMQRSSLSRSQVVSRLQNQMSADEMLILSDFSIRNDGDTPILAKLMDILKALHWQKNGD